MVDLAATTISGAATGAIVISRIMTGGLSVTGIAAGAIIGGIKTMNRAANDIEGDVLSIKQMAKDTCLKVFHEEENTRSLYVRDAYDISACINRGGIL
ncbi:MAG: hypothetical protein LUE64_06210 [Candidatus Gastranaerophilales bacterium]|nr:hypothetical protein [Candidatus Gastranaerophilales bacterium]